MVENDRYCISEETIDKIREYLLSIGVQENHRDYILGRLRSRLYDPVAERKVTPKYGEYQCSWCKRNKFNGDESCPLALDLDISNENSDILNGANRVIKSCGCGSFIDSRSHPAPAPSTEMSAEQRIRDVIRELERLSEISTLENESEAYDTAIALLKGEQGGEGK